LNAGRCVLDVKVVVPVDLSAQLVGFFLGLVARKLFDVR
jgi:hypothetical protein